MIRYVFIYFLAISIYAACLTIRDKRISVRGGRRIPEKRLFAAAWLGGALAIYIVMRVIRHKTLHKRFMIGLPLIMAVQAAVILGILMVVRG